MAAVAVTLVSEGAPSVIECDALLTLHCLFEHMHLSKYKCGSCLSHSSLWFIVLLSMMSSDPSQLQLQQYDQLPSQQDPSNTDTLRVELHQLDTSAQTLKAEKAVLEKRLQEIREKIFANDNLIRHTMENLGSELFRDQRAERQSTFKSSTIENENVIEGIFNQMQGSPQLTSAIHAVVKEQGSVQDNNMVAAAIMLELTGNTFQFGHDVAVQVCEFGKARNAALAAMVEPPIEPGHPYFDPSTLLVDPAMLGEVTGEDRDSSVVQLGDSRDPSVIPFMSPSVKSEANSIATPYNVAALNTTPGNIAASVEPGSPGQAPQANIVAHGMNSLQKSFPGLLESINPSMTTPGHAPTTRARVPAPSPRGKRGRGSSLSDGSPGLAIIKKTPKTKAADKEAGKSCFMVPIGSH